MPSSRSFATATSMVASAARLPFGIFTKPAKRHPAELLVLYEFEACPFCRLVREVLTELDLDALIQPCPKGGTRFRPRAVELGGKAQFPLLVDREAGVTLFESAAIIEHLFRTYGERPVPSAWRLRSLNVMASGIASAARTGAGNHARPSRGPDQQLELYSIETSPFVRLVRERLCELELPYVLHSLGRTKVSESIPPFVRARLGIRVEPETPRRRELLVRAGRVMVPYLIDPNTDTEMFESRDICRYLDATYAA
ncbi:MAG: glutathione S-transferase N-terminal domain-containing protein [Pseudomonadota bacterium]